MRQDSPEHLVFSYSSSPSCHSYSQLRGYVVGKKGYAHLRSRRAARERESAQLVPRCTSLHSRARRVHASISLGAARPNKVAVAHYRWRRPPWRPAGLPPRAWSWAIISPRLSRRLHLPTTALRDVKGFVQRCEGLCPGHQPRHQQRASSKEGFRQTRAPRPPRWQSPVSSTRALRPPRSR